MSRRTKLCITALLLAPLAVPVWHFIQTWHPENPLRFRHVGESLGEDTVFGGHQLVLTMELRNTSDVAVLFQEGTFREVSASREGAIMASGGAIDGRYKVPPGGALEVNFLAAAIPSTEDVAKLQAGEWRKRAGRIEYVWLSGSKYQLWYAYDWCRLILPWNASRFVPPLSLRVGEDNVEVSP